MRADRLLSILMTLQLRGRVTATALAAELEVSTRTIYRDVDALSGAGIPVVTHRGPSGGLSLMDGFRTDLTGLSVDEVVALPFMGLGQVASALGLSGAAQLARSKLLAALPPSGRERAGRASDCFHLDAVDWYRRAPTPPTLREVAAAVWAAQRIDIDYESWQGRRRRVVEPLGLVLKAGHWYLVARTQYRNSPAIFRLSGIVAAQGLPERFTRPARFNLAKTWQDQVSLFEASLRRERATIRLSAQAMSRVDRLGADAAEAIQAAAPDRRGWRRARIWIEGVNHAASLLLGFGTDVEVLAPAALRREIAQRAARLCSMYGLLT
jgi:predicted DNA-binding transcriptional regulator YafY